MASLGLNNLLDHAPNDGLARSLRPSYTHSFARMKRKATVMAVITRQSGNAMASGIGASLFSIKISYWKNLSSIVSYSPFHCLSTIGSRQKRGNFCVGLAAYFGNSFNYYMVWTCFRSHLKCYFFEGNLSVKTLKVNCKKAWLCI